MSIYSTRRLGALLALLGALGYLALFVVPVPDTLTGLYQVAASLILMPTGAHLIMWQKETDND